LNYNVADPYVLCPFVQALLHASVACNRKLVVDWVPAENLEDDTSKEVDRSFYCSACHLTVFVLLYAKSLMICLLLAGS